MNKILFVTTSDLSGSSGNNVATSEMVTAFSRNNRIDVSVLCPAPLDEIPQKVTESVSNFHYTVPHRDGSISTHVNIQISMLLKLKTILYRNDFDLLVIRKSATMISPTLLSKVFNVDYVLLARGLSHEELRFSTVLRQIFWINARFAEDVYCAHSEVVDRVGDIRPRSVSAPILFPNAVDPAEFSPHDKKKARGLITPVYDDSDFVIGFVGSLKRYHMVTELIRAIHTFPENIQLLIVGDGPERESLENLSTELSLTDQITFTGFVEHSDVDKYITACDVMYGAIDPNHSGNAIKCYEYLACSRPIITDKRSEFEFVDKIEAGVTLDEVTVDKITSAIREFESMSPEKRLEMGDRGREYVLENHTWDVLVDLVIERNL